MTEYLNMGFELKGLKRGEFEGHGSVFGNIDHHMDVVVKGAFQETLAKHKRDKTMPQMFWMHQMDQVPGMWLDMSEDDYGLKTRGKLLPTTLGNDMQILLNAKAVRGLSIGFYPTDVDYDRDGIRLIKNVDLLEVSLVSLAANPLAEVESAKARLSRHAEYVPTVRQFEQDLREKVGYSRSVAEQLAAKVFSESSGGSREGDDELELLFKETHYDFDSLDNLFK